MPSTQTRKPVALPARSAEPTMAVRSSKRSLGSSNGGTVAGPLSSRGGTLFRSGSITASATETFSQTSRNLRSFFKGSTASDGAEGSTSTRRARSGTTDGLPVKGKGEPVSPKLVRPTSTEEAARKRKTSLLRRPFSSSATASSTDLTRQRTLKSSTAPGTISQATLAPESAAALPSDLLATDSSSRFTTPNLRVGTLSSPALHLASDALALVDHPVISSSSSVEALVSPPRSRTSTVNTLRAVPASPTPTNTPKKRPTTPATPTGSAGLQSPIHLGSLGSAAGSGRVRHPTAPESPTMARRADSSLDAFDPSPPTPTRQAHKRAHSSPVQLGRLALRSAASFVLKEMARYLPREIKARPNIGWSEGEERLGPLRRAERAWAGSSMVGGEGKEQRVFAEALADGVVLCFLLNRLFSTTLQPPLTPSLRPDQSTATRNVAQFLDALGSLGFTVDQQFAPADLASSTLSPDGLHRVANTLNVLAKMDFDAIAGSSSLKKTPSSGSSSPTASRPGSPASRPSSPSKVVFVLPSDASRKRRSLPVDGSAIELPRFIPPYQSLRRVTPPSPLRRDSVPSSSRKPVSGERSASPTGRRPGHFTASGPLTPPIEDPVALEDYMQVTPRSSPLAAFTRPRTPSLVGAERRVSTESNCSFSSSVATAGDVGVGSVPIIAIGSVGSTSSDSGHGHGVLSTSAAKTLKTILSEEELQGSPRSDASSLGRGHPSALAHANSSLPSLPSILRTVSGSAIPPHSPPGIRSAGVRRVSPSTNIRPSASLRRAGSSADANPVTSSPRRQVARRGMSADMAASGMTMASLVAEAMAAEVTPMTTDGVTPSVSADSQLGELISLEDRPRPLRRNSSQGASGKSYIVRARSLKRAQSPAPLTSSQLEGSALDSAPCTPSPSAITAPRPTSPPQADHQFRRPEFSSRPTPIAHDAYAKPSASRSAQFAVGVAGDGDEHERRRRYSALSSRPSFSHTSSDSVLEHTRGRSGALSRDASSTSLAKGSAHREILTVSEDGKPTSRYALGNCIGRGQFGSVYRALNVGTGEMVAIKRIRLEGLGEEDIAQLMKEVDLVKRLSHPGIVKYEGMSRDENTLDIVLEYVENGSLGSTLKAFGRLNERLVASYVTKILEGLEYLHSQKVVHCDLKAANILTTKVGNVKLSDFGVSLSLVAVEQKKENDVAGTPNWMAPEVIQMEGASTASDIWSLGCVIIELMTGRPPFAECANGMAVMYRIVEGGPPPVPEGATDALRAFLSQCFEKDPSMRPTAEVLSEHVWLESVLADAQLHQLQRKESVPFLRRRSTEIELRRELKRSLSAGPGHRSAGTSERGADDDSEMLVVPIGIDIPGREQQPAYSQAMSLPSSMRAPSFLMAADDLIPRAHTFVKSTFSKPVLCRVCHAHVKRSAVLCEGCTLICHASCVKHAPETCDLGAQLMLTAQRHSQSQQQLYSASAAYPFPSDDPSFAPAAPSSAILSTSPLTLNLSERFLQNLKRSRSPTPSVRRSGDSGESGGIKRFVFPNSRTSEERERQTSRHDRPISRQSSHRPISRQSRLSRIGRSGLSDDSDPAEVDPPVRPVTPTVYAAGGSRSATLQPPVTHEVVVAFENPFSSPTAYQPAFDHAYGQHGGLSRISTRSGDQRSAGHRKKESKDCVIS